MGQHGLTLILYGALMTSVSLNNTLAALPMLFATFLPYTTNPQSQNLQTYDKTCVFDPILYVKMHFYGSQWSSNHRYGA